MKRLFLLLITLLCSYASFAVIGSINGTATICQGTSTTLTDVTTGGTWSSSNTAVATIGSTGTVYGSTAGTTVISYTLGAGTATQVVTVNAAPGPVTGVNIVCAGSTIFVDDGTAGGTWSSGSTAIATIASTGVITGVSAGTVLVSYTIGDGCSSEFEITVYPLPSTITGTATICVGATTTLTDVTTGGTWSSSTANATINPVTGLLSGINAGTAVITYTSNEFCITTVVATINPAAAVMIHALPGDTLCAGMPDSLFATITGTTAIISRQWFRDVSYIGAEDTLVYVPDYGDSLYLTLSAISACTGDTVNLISDTIRITVNPLPVITVSPDPVSVCRDSTLLLTASGAATYSWHPGTGLSCSGCAAPTLTGISNTVYYTVGTTAFGCSDSVMVIVSVDTACTLAVPAISSSGALSIFPNPAYDAITITYSTQEITQVEITDLLGRTVYRQTAPANCRLIQVDVAGLPNGVYFVKVNNTGPSTRPRLTGKFVKE